MLFWLGRLQLHRCKLIDQEDFLLRRIVSFELFLHEVLHCLAPLFRVGENAVHVVARAAAPIRLVLTVLLLEVFEAKTDSAEAVDLTFVFARSGLLWTASPLLVPLCVRLENDVIRQFT